MKHVKFLSILLFAASLAACKVKYESDPPSKPIVTSSDVKIISRSCVNGLSVITVKIGDVSTTMYEFRASVTSPAPPIAIKCE